MIQLQKAILKTLAYGDVFDYPFTLEEIHRFLIKQNAIRNTQEEIKRELNENPYLVSRLTYHDGFYCSRGSQKNVALRKEREKWSQKKLKIAQRVAKYLKLIPFIKMVAVTGNLAMNNAEQKDDIDLLIVTSQNRLWLTRLFTVFLVELAANRRRPKDQEVEDKICLNMFLAEDCLQVPEKEQDLFSAHEVCQLKPIWHKDNTYQEFITQNQWYQKFLPNWKP